MIGNQENIISSVTVEKSEVLRYLGHNGQEIDNDLNSKINQCIKETKNEIDTKYVYQIYDIKKDLKDISLVLVMGVHPGKSGQQYLTNTTDKINKLKEIKEKENLNFKISVDGGINEEILPKLNNTDIIVSASYVLDNLDNIEKIHNL